MSDLEIVKALECCAEKVDYEGNEDTCCSCPLITDDSCTCTLSKKALDLINRLQEENDNYSKNNQQMTSDILKLYKELEQAKAENERLNNAIDEQDIEIARLYKEIDRLKKGWKADVIETANIKAEAYKEFAERLKEMMSYEHFFETDVLVLDKSKLDNLLKELIGE